jgi:hypothetical protein
VTELVRVQVLDTVRTEEIREEVAQKLVEEGVLWQQGNDLYTAENDEEFKNALRDPALMICDFCSSPDVGWLFPTADYTMYRSEGADHISRDEWAACAICAHLIDQELWDLLTEHSVKSFQAQHAISPLASALLYEAVQANTGRFAENRRGPGVRIPGKENAGDT